MNERFAPDEVATISKAGGALLKWVYAIVNYHRVKTTLIVLATVRRTELQG